ncbi:MAG: TonB-dependent receptor [Gemmatimonadota bacterium]|nr:TonB-dependent receptor [Gemmatimonadota bacterium]MDH4348066.1 TonB-dependent receptor [Gemmatimonadota bacterium]MDH5283287.1 TonB-dependent receptor [Gemmatimonadota bacterium]
MTSISGTAWRKPFAVLLMLSGGVPAMAQQAARDTSPVVLETLEVTAERPRAAPPPVATVNLTGAALAHTQAANPYDLFRRAAAVEVHEQGQGPGFASDVVIRGFTSDHSADVLLVVDGVPINLPVNGHGEGYADWNPLVPSSVSSLRLIHGTASPLYGDFALAGTVEVFTAADAAGPSVAVTGASEGALGGWFRTGRRGEQSGSLLLVEGRYDDGWRDNSEYALGNILLRGWRRAGRSGRLEGGLGFYGSGWHSPGFVSVAQFNAGDVQGAADPTDGGSSYRLVAHGRYAAPLGARTAFETVAWGFGSRWDLYLNLPEDGAPPSQVAEHDDRTALGAQATISWTPEAGEFTAGLAGRSDWASYTKAPSVNRDEGTPEMDLDAGYLSGSGFVRWRRTFGGRLGFDVGGRVDVLDYRNRDWLTLGTRHSATHVIVSPKAGARYLLSGSTALLASVSRGFRGAAGVIGDPGRPLLEAWSLEVGGAVAPGPLDLEVSLFRMEVSNERIQDPVTGEISSAGTSRRQGVDLRGSLQLWDTGRLTFGATWNDARLTGEYADAHGEAALQEPGVIPLPDGPRFRFHEELDFGERVPGVAQYVGQFGLTTVLGGRFTASLGVRLLGPYVPIGEPDVETQPYLVADLGALVPLASTITADVSLQNLFDREYPELRSSGFVNPGRPRTLRVAFTWAP